MQARSGDPKQDTALQLGRGNLVLPEVGGEHAHSNGKAHDESDPGRLGQQAVDIVARHNVSAEQTQAALAIIRSGKKSTKEKKNSKKDKREKKEKSSKGSLPIRRKSVSLMHLSLPCRTGHEMMGSHLALSLQDQTDCV